MERFVPKSQKGKDTLKYIDKLLKEGYEGNIIEAAVKFREEWQENQLPEGYYYTETKEGLPLLNHKEIPLES